MYYSFYTHFLRRGKSNLGPFIRVRVVFNTRSPQYKFTEGESCLLNIASYSRHLKALRPRKCKVKYCDRKRSLMLKFWWLYSVDNENENLSFILRIDQIWTSGLCRQTHLKTNSRPHKKYFGCRISQKMKYRWNVYHNHSSHLCVI